MVVLVACALSTTRGAAEIADSTFASANLTTAGTLSTVLKDQGYDLAKIKRIVVSGKINNLDFNTLGKTMVNLTDIDLSAANTFFIPDEAFEDNDSLQSFKAPAALISIGQGAFSGCSRLEEIRFGFQLAYIGIGAFENCSSLKEADLSGCGNLGLDSNCFSNCTALEYVSLPPYIKSLRYSAFGNCNHLRKMVVHAKTPLLLQDNPFTEVNIDSCELIVPIGSAIDYSKASFWSSFANINEMGVLVNIGPNGRVTLNGETLENGQVVLHDEAEVTFRVMADPGYEVAAFTVNGHSESLDDNCYQLAAGIKRATVAVSFKLKTFSTQVIVKGEGVLKYDGVTYKDTVITLSADSASFLQLSLFPSSGHVIDSVLFNGLPCVVQQDSLLYTLPLTGDANLFVSFASAAEVGTQYRFVVETSPHGSLVYRNTLLLPSTTLSIKQGESARFIIVPDTCYILDKLLLNGVDVTDSVVNHAFVMECVESDASVSVSFRINPEATVKVLVPGTFSTYFMKEQYDKITKLTISGSINASDFYFIRDSLKQVIELDIRQTNFMINGKKTIPMNAFSNHSKLSSIQLPPDLWGIGSDAFSNCRSLSAIHLPASINRIGINAFNGDDYLITLTLDALVPPIIDVRLGNTMLLLVFVPNEAVSAYENDYYWSKYFILGSSTVSVDVYVETPGTLSSLLTKQGVDLTNVTKLVVTGTLNAEDFRVMRQDMTLLNAVDISGTNVEAIPSSAFEGKVPLMSFKAPTCLKTIGEKAFYGCTFLKDVPFGSQIVTIGSRAFEYCRLMAGNLTFPPMFSTLGVSAFGRCYLLDTVDFSACLSLKEIPVNAFWDCKGLKVVTFSPTINRIGEAAFAGCTTLKSIDLTMCSSLTLDNSCFNNCSSLESISLPNLFSGFGSFTFSNCTQLKKVFLRAQIPPTISEYVFQGVNLSTCELIVPTGSAKAYSLAPNWSSFSTPKEVGVLVNFGVNGLVISGRDTLVNKQVIFHDEAEVSFTMVAHPGFEVAGITVNGQPATLEGNHYQLAAGIQSATLVFTFKPIKFPVQVTVKGEGSLMYGDTVYKDTVFVLAIDSASNARLSVLTPWGYGVDSVYFNGDVSVVQMYNTLYVSPRIEGPSELLLTFAPDGTLGTLHRIEVRTGDDGLVEYLHTPLIKDTTDFFVPGGSSVVFTFKPDPGYLLDEVYYDGENVTHAVVDNQYTIPSVTESGMLSVSFKVNTTLRLALRAAGTMSQLVTPLQKKFVTHLTLTGYIDERDVYFMRDSMDALTVLDLSRVTVGSHQTLESPFSPTYEIPTNAFCKGWENGKKTLTEVYLPTNTRSVGFNAFMYCRNLKTINLEQCSSLEGIKGSAFYGTALEKLSFPASLTSIEPSAFYNCSHLTSVDLSQTAITTIQQNCFKFCVNLEEVLLPTTLTYISKNAFSYCSALKSLDLSAASILNTIGLYAFMGAGLESIKFPASLASIGAMAFANDTALTNISALNPTPALLSQDVFNAVNTQRCVLSIPKASYNAYLNAQQWRNFVQSRNVIDVTVSTGGTVTFASVDTVQLEEVNPITAMTWDGARMCVPVKQAVRFLMTPEVGAYIERVRYNNVDVTDQVVNGLFTTPMVSASINTLEILFHKGIMGLEQTREAVSQVTRVYVRDGIVHVSNEEAMQQVAVYDVKGALLFRSNTPDRQYQCTNLSSGFYIVRVLLHSGKVENVKVRL